MMRSLLHVARPLGGWRVIYADPPWRYRGYASDGVPQRAAVQHYETMALDDLKALPVGMVAAKSAIVAMWVISSHLDQAMDLGRAWGFEFKTLLFVWNKGKMGLGKWTRQEAEICLLFTRGKPSRRPGAGGVRQVLLESPREHSRKPEAFAGRLEELCRGPYLEMFAQSPREGWDVWGDSIDKYAAAQ